MDEETLQRLNQLNQTFYVTVATSFDESRSQAWQGWLQLESILNTKAGSIQPLSLLDLGCGNGRFGVFLQEKVSGEIAYDGWDNNKQLLQSAAEKLKQTNLSFSLTQLDLLEKIQEAPSPRKFDAITAFGIFHHIPSQKLRHKLIDFCYQQLSPDGILILTFWHFTQLKQFQRQAQDSTISSLGIDATQLEPNDYILDWQRGKSAYRYCHLVSQAEETQLIESQKWDVLSNFWADGHDSHTNHYLVLQKK